MRLVPEAVGIESSRRLLPALGDLSQISPLVPQSILGLSLKKNKTVLVLVDVRDGMDMEKSVTNYVSALLLNS